MSSIEMQNPNSYMKRYGMIFDQIQQPTYYPDKNSCEVQTRVEENDQSTVKATTQMNSVYYITLGRSKAIQITSRGTKGMPAILALFGSLA